MIAKVERDPGEDPLLQLFEDDQLQESQDSGKDQCPEHPECQHDQRLNQDSPAAIVLTSA
jgi:hypothetical protein